MGVVRSGHFWQFASLATETTGGEILVAFWSKHGLRSDLRVPNFPGGAASRPPSLFTLERTQLWPYQSKIAGSGQVSSEYRHPQK